MIDNGALLGAAEGRGRFRTPECAALISAQRTPPAGGALIRVKMPADARLSERNVEL